MVTSKDIHNRFDYHAPDAVKIEKHTSVRVACEELAIKINSSVPDGREKATALTKVEEAMFWANAAIARNNDEDTGGKTRAH